MSFVCCTVPQSPSQGRRQCNKKKDISLNVRESLERTQNVKLEEKWGSGFIVLSSPLLSETYGKMWEQYKISWLLGIRLRFKKVRRKSFGGSAGLPIKTSIRTWVPVGIQNKKETEKSVALSTMKMRAMSVVCWLSVSDDEGDERWRSFIVSFL